MFTNLETLKKQNFRMIALLKRRIVMVDQIQLAQEDDKAARAKLMDLNLPADEFTKASNEARAAQRRRANLEDKLIDLELAVDELYDEMAYELDFARNSQLPENEVTVEVETVETAECETEIQVDEVEEEKVA